MTAKVVHPGSRLAPGDTVQIYRAQNTELHRAHGRTPEFDSLGQVVIASDGTVDLTALSLPVTEPGREYGESVAGDDPAAVVPATGPQGPGTKPIAYSAFKAMPEGQPDVWVTFRLA